jgi:hypothetical protein
VLSGPQTGPEFVRPFGWLVRAVLSQPEVGILDSLEGLITMVARYGEVVMTNMHLAVPPDEPASMFLGTSRARMNVMVHQNRVRDPHRYLTDDHDEAENCACDHVSRDIYWGQVLAAAELNGKSLRALGLKIEATDFETVAARFIADSGEDDLLGLERELPAEVLQLTAKAWDHMTTSLRSRDRASVENRPVIMILDGGRMRSRGDLCTAYKVGADIHPLDGVLLGVVDVPLRIFALWKEQFLSGVS